MEIIHLRQTLPQVFADRDPLHPTYGIRTLCYKKESGI